MLIDQSLQKIPLLIELAIHLLEMLGQVFGGVIHSSFDHLHTHLEKHGQDAHHQICQVLESLHSFVVSRHDSIHSGEGI